MDPDVFKHGSPVSLASVSIAIFSQPDDTVVVLAAAVAAGDVVGKAGPKKGCNLSQDLFHVYQLTRLDGTVKFLERQIENINHELEILRNRRTVGNPNDLKKIDEQIRKLLGARRVWCSSISSMLSMDANRVFHV
ncbi:hypothetical protein ABKA04_009974 [Annulohypoxylon sp. FPYF3050]